MTVCLAAICGAPHAVVGASDLMLTSGHSIEYESGGNKFFPISRHLAVMWAGDWSTHSDALSDVRRWVGGLESDPNQLTICVKDAAERYRNSISRATSRLAEATILAPLGLTLREFLVTQRLMAPEQVGALTSGLIQFQPPFPVEAIVAGIDDDGPHIYSVDHRNVVCHDAEGFMAVGIGATHAASQFMFARYARWFDLPRALLLTLTAKRRAEVAPGVGPITRMFCIREREGFEDIDSNLIKVMDEVYDARENQFKESSRLANEEIAKFLSELGRKQAGQPTGLPAESGPTGEVE